MTVEELVTRCRKLIAANERAYVEPETLEMARAIVDMLAEDAPCGFEPPVLTRFPDGDVRINTAYGQHSPSELRAICAMLLRSADKADSIMGKGERDVDKS